jgi:hypothetical protein
MAKLAGRKIVGFRPMTKAELAYEGWDDFRGAASVLVLDDGTLIYASQDEEGNGPGALFTKKGNATGIILATEKPMMPVKPKKSAGKKSPYVPLGEVKGVR